MEINKKISYINRTLKKYFVFDKNICTWRNNIAEISKADTNFQYLNKKNKEIKIVNVIDLYFIMKDVENKYIRIKKLKQILK